MNNAPSTIQWQCQCAHVFYEYVYFESKLSSFNFIAFWNVFVSPSPSLSVCKRVFELVFAYASIFHYLLNHFYIHRSVSVCMFFFLSFLTRCCVHIVCFLTKYWSYTIVCVKRVLIILNVLQSDMIFSRCVRIRIFHLHICLSKRGCVWV